MLDTTHILVYLRPFSMRIGPLSTILREYEEEEVERKDLPLAKM